MALLSGPGGNRTLQVNPKSLDFKGFPRHRVAFRVAYSESVH